LSLLFFECQDRPSMENLAALGMELPHLGVRYCPEVLLTVLGDGHEFYGSGRWASVLPALEGDGVLRQ
jgi:hypothetical protein